VVSGGRRRPWIVQADSLALPDGPGGPGHVTVDGDGIAGVAPGHHPSPDLYVPGCLLAPGFIDLQINGAAGCDFLFPTDAGLESAAAYLLRTGTVAYLPTLISAPEDRLRAALGFFADRLDRPGIPRILGVHLEGPFLSPVRPGAHRLEHLRPPTVAWIAAIVRDFPGLIRLVTLAPELDGAEGVVEFLTGCGITVSAGHTDASYEQAAAAFARGVRLTTHLFNAMRPYHHREPGVVGAALGDPRVACAIIADHVHLHPAVVDHVIALKGPERTVLVTDAISAAGAATATLTLGDQTVHVAGGAPRLEDGTLAGSVLAMDQAVRAVAGRWGMEQAVRMAASAPARVLGVPGGEICQGAPADLVLLDAGGAVRAVIASGRLHRPAEGQAP
jgi:N-acetylglucosamine-6-phosphate deacetylase